MPGQNLVGPFGTGVNESYETPDFGDSAGSQFSWFVDCSDGVTPDGTRWMAQWANRMMLQVRRAVVGMGIPLNETNGDSLLDAIKRAHRPIVNVGGGAALHKGEKMPEWQHELRSIVGAGTVTVQVVGDTVVITGAAGSSVTLQSLGSGVPVYKGISGSVHQFRSLMADAGIAVVSGANEATFRLAPIPGWSIMLRNGASADVPAGVAIDELDEVTSPALVDWLMLQRNPGRQLRKVKVENIRGGLWEIAGQHSVSSPIGTIDFSITADRYIELRVMVEGLAFATYSGGQQRLAVLLLNNEATLTEHAYRPGDEGDGQVIFEANGESYYFLSSLNNRAILHRNLSAPYFQLTNASSEASYADPLVQRFLTPTPIVHVGAQKSTPVNKVRVQARKNADANVFSSFTLDSFTAGLVTVYGLKRSH